MHVAAVFLEHGRMGVAESSLASPRLDMKQIYVRLNLPGNPDALLQIMTAFKKLRAAHTKFYGKIRPHRLPRRLFPAVRKKQLTSARYSCRL